MLAFSGIDKSRKPNKYWYKACRVINETKGNGGFEVDWARATASMYLRVTDVRIGKCWDSFWVWVTELATEKFRSKLNGSKNRIFHSRSLFQFVPVLILVWGKNGSEWLTPSETCFLFAIVSVRIGYKFPCFDCVMVELLNVRCRWLNWCLVC